MVGITQNRINNVKDIDLIQYLLDKYADKFYQRPKGELVYKANRSLVVYKDHAYDFGEVAYPLKDSIYIERLLSGCSFSEAIERIEIWKKCKKAEEHNAIQLDLFDSIYSDCDDVNSQDDLMIIPEGIDYVSE